MLFLFHEVAAASSAQLEAGRRLDGVQQLVPHQVLVAELGQLEQVHAGAGGGQALQVCAAVVDAEDRVELLCRWGDGGGAVKELLKDWSQKRRWKEFSSEDGENELRLKI